MNEILNRIHLGIMGNALCHATYGWFCGEEPVIEIVPDIIRYDLSITPVVELELEL